MARMSINIEIDLMIRRFLNQFNFTFRIWEEWLLVHSSIFFVRIGVDALILPLFDVFLDELNLLGNLLALVLLPVIEVVQGFVHDSLEVSKGNLLMNWGLDNFPEKHGEIKAEAELNRVNLTLYFCFGI